MKITVDTHLRLPPGEARGLTIGLIADALTFRNPGRDRARREMTWGWEELPETIRLWEATDQGVIVLPRGFAKRLNEIASGLEDQVEYEDLRSDSLIDTRGWRGVQLREHQALALDWIERMEQGVYRAPPGSGKTVVILETIRHLGRRALVIVNSSHIAEQWRERARQHIRFEPGLIGDGVWEETGLFDLAIQQTLWSRRDELDPSWWSQFGFVCLDECHHSAAHTFYDVIQRFDARWRIGVSATPHKDPGMEPLVEASIGPVFHETPKEQLVDAQLLAVPTVMVLESSFTRVFWPTHQRREDGTCGHVYCTRKGEVHRNNYSDITSDLVEDVDRNSMIAHAIRAALGSGRTILVLSKRLKHLDAIARILAKQRGTTEAVYRLTGKESRSARVEVYERAELGGCVIFSTLGYEAMDIPRLDTLFLVWPTRNGDLLRQQVGRIERIHPQKQEPMIFDIRDGVGILRSQLGSRLDVYEAEGYPVTFAG